MKACKIILIVLYILGIILNLLRTFAADDDEQLSYFLATLVHAIGYGILYSAVGIFDL